MLDEMATVVRHPSERSKQISLRKVKVRQDRKSEGVVHGGPGGAEMIDLGDALEEVLRSPDWTAEMAYRAASSLVAATSVVLDWDRDAGENWISLLLGDARVGMISALVPLAIIEDGDAVSIPRSASLGLAAISVPTFDDAILLGDSDRLATVFGSTAVTLRNGVPFSANDLWFATI